MSENYVPTAFRNLKSCFINNFKFIRNLIFFLFRNNIFITDLEILLSHSLRMEILSSKKIWYNMHWSAGK